MFFKDSYFFIKTLSFKNEFMSNKKCDVIFHIGFPKCASTTLQNQIFKKEKG